jgi:hypothetical protein
MKDCRPLQQIYRDLFEPVKPYISSDPIEKEELISRLAGHVDYHVLNFLKRFSFYEIRKAGDELIIV